MLTFRDTKNREWKIESNVGTVKRVRDALQINLLDLADEKSNLLTRLRDEPWLLCDILYAACRPQMDAAGATAEDFAESMGGDSLAVAFEAVQDCVILFSTGGRRSLLKTVFEKQAEVEAATIDLAMTRLQDPALVERIKASVQRQIDEALTPPKGT